MKKTWIIVLVILVVLIGVGYLGRHKIKALFGMSITPTPIQTATVTMVPTSSSSAQEANNIYMTKSDAVKGTYLTDFQGMTLYTFDKDTTGMSTCYNGCAKAWPPYTSGATAQSTLPENITVITRTDGTKQFAWKGMPLYYYATDQKAGDVTGDGVGGVWHIVKQ